MALSPSVLAARDLVFNCPGTPCLDLADLVLAPGKTTLLARPSGSGKSTLLNLLAGVLTPASGTLELLGVPWPERGAGATGGGSITSASCSTAVQPRAVSLGAR
jgi:energy-coupling factor transporter ATP-binding protein EcfA2